MNLASAAPLVEPATALSAPRTEAAIASAATPSGIPIVDEASAVGPAVTVDDPKKFAPNVDKSRTEAGVFSAAELRGTGTDFEGKAAVLRGAPKKTALKRILPIVFDERDFVSYGEVLRYVLIKGNCIFIYADSTDPAPLYAIPIEDMTPILENPKKPDKDSVTISPAPNTHMPKQSTSTVLLKYRSTGKQAYQFTFDEEVDKGLSKRFIDVLEVNGLNGGNKAKAAAVTASVMKANEIGKHAARAQPRKSHT